MSWSTARRKWLFDAILCVHEDNGGHNQLGEREEVKGGRQVAGVITQCKLGLENDLKVSTL